MKILFLGSFFPEPRYQEILSDSIGVIQNAGDTYQKAVLNGLSQHIGSFKIITSPMVGSYPARYKKLFFKSSSFEYLGQANCICSEFINLPLYKNISKYIYVKKYVISWIKSNPGIKHIIVFSLDISLLRVIYEIKEKYQDIKLCLIVTDLIEFMVVPKSILSKFIMEYFDKKASKYLKKVDSFVLLTEYMKDKLKVGERPYIIMEGIFNNVNTQKIVSYEKEIFKTILYSGTLANVYGIIHLLNAFSKIDNANYRLWICGEGDSRNEVLRRAENDNRIKYFGQLNREEVLILQKKATVLINPRFSDSEFTLHSFPSKTMEYLASGTPTIMHPLKCLPEEYYNFIFTAQDETDAGLMNTIFDVCEKNKEELKTFGENAAQFILTKKNSYVQVKRMLELMDYEK